jgi:hypothetical protein
MTGMDIDGKVTFESFVRIRRHIQLRPFIHECERKDAIGSFNTEDRKLFLLFFEKLIGCHRSSEWPFRSETDTAVESSTDIPLSVHKTTLVKKICNGSSAVGRVNKPRDEASTKTGISYIVVLRIGLLLQKPAAARFKGSSSSEADL